jgi:hypothetical protein
MMNVTAGPAEAHIAHPGTLPAVSVPSNDPTLEN